MSDKEPNYELDDELLSAYLDDELSSEERAAVEARLAADPAAQRLLHELRLISQSVQSLPIEIIGRDLSETIVRRAREAKTASSEAEPSRLGDALPKITVFGSKRAWIWASLALAAGLLIMVVQSGDERAKNLPTVAQHDERNVANQPAEEAAQGVRREPAVSADHELAPPASVASESRALERPAPGAAMPTQPLGELGDVAKEVAPAGSPIAAASTAPKKENVGLIADGASSFEATSAGKPSIDKLGSPSQATGHASAVGGALSINAGGGKLEAAGQQIPLVIVRVVAKREALQNKSFDRLLVSHGITVEPEPRKELKEQTPDFGGGRYAEQVEKERDSNRLSDKAAADQDVDMVLVEAPAPAIMSCLAGLNQDSDNYVGVEVDEATKPSDRADAKSTLTKTLAQDLSKYSRGVVPQRQKDSLRPNDYFGFYDYDVPSERAANASPRGGDLSDRSSVGQHSNGTEALDRKRTPADILGRARRIQTRHIENPQDAGQPARSGRLGGQAGDETQKKPTPERMLKERAKLAVDKVQVLFVFSPEAASVPGAPPANRAK